MTTEIKTGDLTKVADRAAWERPAMVRLDAADAEMMVGAGSDMMSGQSMNS